MKMVQNTDRHNKKEVKDELVEKLVHVNRVAKTVKGGRTISFAAVVVVGDQKGRIGMGTGKAMEVPDAIVKASNEARKNMVRIPLREGRTLHHDISGRFGAGKVVLRTAPAGTGVIAGGPMRAVFEVLGVQDVVAKSLGSNNPYNMIKATFAALKAINSPRMVAAKRGKKVGEIVSETGVFFLLSFAIKSRSRVSLYSLVFNAVAIGLRLKLMRLPVLSKKSNTES